jgi:hypothetical protein
VNSRAQVGPQHAAGDVLDHLEHVMVVGPVDTHVDEAEQVAEQADARRVPQAAEGGHLPRLAQLKDHDRDDDGEHAVAERLDAAGRHGFLLTAGGCRRREFTGR